MVITFPCSACTGITDDNDNYIYCDKYNLWVHIKCNDLNFLDLQYLNGNDDPWFCLKCSTELFPFDTLNNKIFNQYINNKNIQNKDIDQDNSSNLVVKLPHYLINLITHLKSMTSKNLKMLSIANITI